MVDTCRVERQAPRVGTSSATGRDVLPSPVGVYEGVCRVQLAGSQEDVRVAGERPRTVQRLTLSLPMAATGVQVGDVVTVTAASLDASLVGRRYRVVQAFAKTHATARRLGCEEVTA